MLLARLVLAIDWLLLSFLIALPVYLHGGGLVAYGCHHDRKAGGGERLDVRP